MVQKHLLRRYLFIREHAANLYTTGMTPIPSTVKMEDTLPQEDEEPPEEEALPVKTPVTTTPPATILNTQSGVDGTVESSPLIQLSSEPRTGVQTAPSRERGRYPLIRQQSAPPESFFSRTGVRQSSLESGQNLSEFSNVELRKKDNKKSRPNSGESGSSALFNPDATEKALRKALRSSRSSQYKGVSIASLVVASPLHALRKA